MSENELYTKSSIIKNQTDIDPLEDPFREPAPEELKKLAFSDELTGINNRRYLKYRAPAFIEVSRKKGKSLCLAMLDMDGFKSINDTYGHLAGDTLLINFARILSEHIEGKGIPVRYAGDEFIAIFFDHEKKTTKKILEGLFQKLEKTKIDIGDGFQLNIRLSAGVASFPNDAEDYESLFKRADEALYTAKRSGKGMVVVYPDGGKLIAIENISTIFPVEKMIGFEEQFGELCLNSIDRPKGEKSTLCLPIVCGPRGSGKTRILNELGKKAQRRGMGRIYLSGVRIGGFPYRALIIAFGEVLRKDPILMREICGVLTIPEKNELSRHIPELANIPGGIEPLEKEDKRELLFNGLQKIFNELLVRSPQVLLMDDANYIDPATLAFVDSFVAENQPKNLYIAMSIEITDDPSSVLGISRVLGELNRISQKADVARIDLPKFTVKNIYEMIYQVIGSIDIPSETLEMIAERSRGNPLFIERLLAIAIEWGYITYDGTRWIIKDFRPEDLPATIDEMHGEFEKKLSKDDFEILRKAAVIGQDFDLNVLAKISGLSEQEVMDTLERARQANMISENTSGEMDFSFSSTEERMALYSKIDSEERKKIHLSVAQAETELHPERIDEVFGKLAYHFQQADRWNEALESMRSSEQALLDAKLPESVRNMLLRRASMDVLTREHRLEREDFPKAIKALRAIKSAMQALRLYPRDNENVSKSILRAFDEINYLLGKTEVLSFSATHEVILVNGEQPPPEATDDRFARDFYDFISPYGIQGIFITVGITEEELGNFLEIFKSRPEDVIENWEDIVFEKNLEHIKPNRTVYVTLNERNILLSGQPVIAPETAKTKKEIEAEETSLRALDRIQKLLKDFREDSKDLLKKIKQKESVENPVEELIKVLNEMRGYLPETVIRPDYMPPAKPTEADKEAEDETAQDRGFAFGDITAIDHWLNDLKSENIIVKARAAQNIVRFGRNAIEPCIDAIRKEESLETRRLLAMFIAKSGEFGVAEFSAFIRKKMPEDELAKFISVADVFKNDREVQEFIIDLSIGSNRVLRESVNKVLAKFPDKVKVSAIEKGMLSSNNEIKALSIMQAAELGVEQMVPEILAYLNRNSIINLLPDTTVTIAAIQALAKMKSQKAVESLAEIVRPVGFFRKEAFPEIICIEAITALDKIGGEKAINAIQKATKSRNKNIRDSAIAVLSRRNI